jgi:membrane-associated protein
MDERLRILTHTGNETMINLAAFRSRPLRMVALAVTSWLVLGAFLPAFADGPGENAGDTNFFWQVFLNLLNSRGLMEILGKPEYMVAAILTINLIVFVETGLLLGFCLPGDSLLVTAGVICFESHWNLGVLLGTVSLSAIVGDSLGYAIGYKTGPKIFCREKSLFFNKHHLLHAQAFYEKHGGKTIILARFMPILRTFAPVVAGVGRMNYWKFLAYNVVGGVSWVVSMILIGYFLPSVLNAPLSMWFGQEVHVEKHVEKIVILVVLISIAPGILMWLRSRFVKPQPVGHGEISGLPSSGIQKKAS